MTQVNETTQKENKIWLDMLYRLWVWLPTHVLKRMDEGKQDGPSHGYTWVVTAVIVGLSYASASNMTSVGGILIAISVPVAVFASAHKGKDLTGLKRFMAWTFAIALAITSAMLQFRSHVDGTYTLATMFSAHADLYALATSVGIPVVECAMAALAAAMEEASYREWMSQKATEKAEQIAADQEAETLAQKEIEREEREALRLAQIAQREHDQRMAQLEAEAHLAQQQAEFDQRLRLQEAQRLAQIEADKEARLIEAQGKEAARLAKAQNGSGVKRGVPQNDESGASNGASNGVPQKKGNKVFNRRISLIDLIKERGTLSLNEAADALGSTASTVGRDIDFLVAKEVITKSVDEETRKMVLAVNGHENAFRSGELA